MKYIDAEKLRAEIKRQKHELELSIQSQGDYGQSCHIVAYDNILSLIDSLQQEQPKVDLDAEIEMEWDSFNKHLAEYDKEAEEVVWLNRFSFEDIAHYFCKLGRKQVLKEIYDGKVKPVDKITAAWLDDKEEDK